MIILPVLNVTLVTKKAANRSNVLAARLSPETNEGETRGFPYLPHNRFGFIKTSLA